MGRGGRGAERRAQRPQGGVDEAPPAPHDSHWIRDGGDAGDRERDTERSVVDSGVDVHHRRVAVRGERTQQTFEMVG